MAVETHTNITIDVTTFHAQHELIRKMVTNLESGRTGIAIMPDLPLLQGVLATLDEISVQNNFDGADDFSYLDEGPDCPGCTNPGDCEDCEYETN